MSTAARRTDAVADLYTKHNSWLQGWLRRKLGCSQRAAELAQDTFLRLLSGPQPVTPREPRAYLATIANALVVNHWRRQALERAYLEELAARPEEYAPTPEERSLILETLEEISRLLDALKPPVRTAFLLAQLDGMTCPQIAEHLGVSVSTVERHIAKALRSCYALRFEP